jgi:hypothetical protein
VQVHLAVLAVVLLRKRVVVVLALLGRVMMVALLEVVILLAAVLVAVLRLLAVQVIITPQTVMVATAVMEQLLELQGRSMLAAVLVAHTVD